MSDCTQNHISLSLCNDNELCKTICPFESTTEKKEKCVKRQNCKASTSQLESKYQRLDHKCSEDNSFAVKSYFHNTLGSLSSTFSMCSGTSKPIASPSVSTPTSSASSSSKENGSCNTCS